MNSNFGDLGVSVKTLVDEYQEKSKMNTSIQSIGIELNDCGDLGGNTEILL